MKTKKFLLIIYSLYLRESSSHKYCFVFLDTSISYMFDLIDALGSHYRLPFRSRNNIPHIIFHDGLTIFDHGIFPNLMTCCLSMTRRLKYVWSLSLKKCTWNIHTVYRSQTTHYSDLQEYIPLCELPYPSTSLQFTNSTLPSPTSST
jgi:hypothetical protein